ncbi:MAG: hypothetical protein WCI20_11355, partial [bacterium]
DSKDLIGVPGVSRLGHLIAIILADVIKLLRHSRDGRVKIQKYYGELDVYKNALKDETVDDATKADILFEFEEFDRKCIEVAGYTYYQYRDLFDSLLTADKHVKALMDSLVQTLEITDKSWEDVREQATIAAENLPELSKDTWKDWFDVAWELLLKLTDRHPENNKILKPIGASAQKSGGNRSGVMSYSKTVKSNVKNEIKKAITRSFLVCCNIKIVKDPLRKISNRRRRVRRRRTAA